jgi:hypothetical protein
MSGSHGGKYEDDCLLGCCAISLVEVHRRLRGARCLHHQAIITRRNIPEDIMTREVQSRTNRKTEIRAGGYVIRLNGVPHWSQTVSIQWVVEQRFWLTLVVGGWWYFEVIYFLIVGG